MSPVRSRGSLGSDILSECCILGRMIMKFNLESEAQASYF